MSKEIMLQTLQRIETSVKKSSNAYRTLVSNYEIHDITIKAADIINQVEAEMLAREGGRALTSKTKELIKKEVNAMCQTLFDQFNPANYNANKQKWTISSEFKGTAKDFTFVLASKPGSSANVFNTFKKAKQVAQRPLITALNKKIKELNRGSKNQRELISSRKGFLDIGHDDRSSVSLQRAAKAQEMLWKLDSKPNLSPLALKVIDELSTDLKWTITRSKSGPPRDTIGISLESKALNRASVSKGEVSDINSSLKKAADAIKWADIGGSDSPAEARMKEVANSFISPLKGKKNVKVTGASNKRKKSKLGVASITSKTGRATQKRFKDKDKTSLAQRTRKSFTSNPLAMVAHINRRLPDTVRKNMQSPGLENRTGRFADSVRVTDVIQTPRGYPSIGFTYQREPYQVFETGSSGPWSSPERDPRHLIDRSIREIAAELAIGRFYTRRV